MNRQQRRGAAKSTWATGIHTVANEAAGMMSLTVIRPIDVPALILAALAGDPDALRLAHVVNELADHVRAAGTGTKSAMCGCCDAALLAGPFSAVVAVPYRDDPTRCITMGICKVCGTEPDAIEAKAIEGLRRIFPDGRKIEMHHGGGRA